jgi:hypothetical protein
MVQDVEKYKVLRGPGATLRCAHWVQYCLSARNCL